MPKRRRSRIRRRYNPYMAVIGFIMMLIGATIVLVLFVLKQDVNLYINWIVIGVAMAFVGWVLQIVFGKRQPTRHS